LSNSKAGGFALKKKVEALLQSGEVRTQLDEWSRFPPQQVINPLLSFLYSGDERLKWRTVSAIGFVMSAMADENMEAAREIMRRLIWNLNDESGGIGWGSPEAMGEIMASHEKLAKEYAHLLASYIRPDGNPLEHALLERGVLWGLGRLAQDRSHLLRNTAPYLLPYLRSNDPFHRGLAAWALGFFKADVSREPLEPLLNDRTQIRVFENGRLSDFRICELAQRTLEAITQSESTAR
jgi:HEAT repeat protein